MAKKPNYEVGRGKPPKHTRFKPGQSGNPKGRPKRARNLRAILEEAFDEMVTLREGGKTRQVTKQVAMIQAALNKAMKGNERAFDKLLKWAERIGVFHDDKGDKRQKYGVIVAPAPMTDDEWIKMFSKPPPDGAKDEDK